MIKVDTLLRLLTRAYRKKSRAALINDVQHWSKDHAREALITDETYAAYKVNAAVQCHIGTALVLLEYLSSHRTLIKDTTAAKSAQDACIKLLRHSKKRRFDRSAAQEPSVEGSNVDRASGAYVLIRVESQLAKLCQELLVLEPAEKNEKVRHATLIGSSIVMRGHWHLFGSSVYVNTVGYRVGHEPDFITISFLRPDNNDDLTSGVLTGLTTKNREPVTMCVVLIRIRNFDPSLYTVSDLSDVDLTREFAASVPRRLSTKQKGLLDDVHKEIFGEDQNAKRWWFEQRIINPSDRYIAGIRGHEALSQLISPGLLKFCQRERRE
jgi:hypothetical protein